MEEMRNIDNDAFVDKNGEVVYPDSLMAAFMCIASGLGSELACMTLNNKPDPDEPTLPVFHSPDDWFKPCRIIGNGFDIDVPEPLTGKIRSQIFRKRSQDNAAFVFLCAKPENQKRSANSFAKLAKHGLARHFVALGDLTITVWGDTPECG
ncbi:hypothetical protein GGF32_007010, partial [Allomyces javanicus]